MSQDPEKTRLADLERRLAAAEAARTQGSSQGDKGSGGSQKGMASGLRVITELLGAALGGLVIGLFIDWALGTRPWGLLIFLALAIAAAFRNLWKMASRPASGGGEGRD